MVPSFFFQQPCVSLICSVSKALGFYSSSSYTFIVFLNLLHMTDFSLLAFRFKNDASQGPRKGTERGFQEATLLTLGPNSFKIAVR